MPDRTRRATPGLRSALAGACLVAAVAAGPGCGGLRIAPTDAAWTVAGEDDGAERATWTAGDVAIAVPLQYDAGTTHVSAEVRNSGPDAARVTFSAASGAATVPLGSVSGGPPAFDRLWSEPLLAGRPVDVPGGTPASPGAVRVALRAGAPYGAAESPAVGTAVAFDVAVRSKSGDAACPFRFTVTRSSGRGWAGLSESDQWLVLALLVIVAIGAIALAGSGGSSGDDLDDYPMGN